MRAIIINAQDRTITETDIDGSLKSLQQIVGGLIEPVYQGLDDDHHCYIDEEGLLDNPPHFFMFTDGHQPLAGNGVILSSTDDGGEAPCTLSLDWVRERVTFMDCEDVRQWARRHEAENWSGAVARRTTRFLTAENIFSPCPPTPDRQPSATAAGGSEP
jgi:hypothetical protein